ncbi:hypothetical protein FNV43_RR15786 [Rhamnella rubrinervis]|uniref:Uncharacterized protein n=1 Tax=Rhamnella rubrinervis TaxID=2594499 RepID=A0A8K0E822_9ROSA|nr:hypothetical protein FNV43_RR15786 [Rhamnella rubrinervis]
MMINKAVVVLLLLVGMMVSGCYAEHMRRGLLGIGGVYGQEQRHRVKKGKAIEGGYKERAASVKYPERSVDNHHSIPRQYYNDPDNDDNGNGAP